VSGEQSLLVGSMSHVHGSTVTPAPPRLPPRLPPGLPPRIAITVGGMRASRSQRSSCRSCVP
jgi:hypothetical protein